ncbi:MAG TPA: rhodanese-like domain-containing protein [Candidatus Eisenbacteria bacterium]|nr:rhodanese-like domain-containing protein [Candidatus Eisenbacteria bacterium]
MPESINRAELQTLVHNGAQLIEVLGPKQYEQAHIPGAVNIPLWKLDRTTTAELNKTRPVIVYCNDFQ